MIKMEALKFTLSSKSLKLVKLEVPKIEEPNQLLIKVVSSGICGTDLHILKGEFPCEPNTPITLGHEFCGTVIEVGDQVKNFQKGDRIAIDPDRNCNVCHDCHLGNPHYCQVGGIYYTLGIFKDGGWANYCVVPECQVYKLPDEMTFEQAALAEPISCIAHGLDRIAPVFVGEKILIIGAGIMGSLWSSILHLQGHRKVTIAEPNKTRLQLAQNMDTGFECITPDELQNRSNENFNYLFDIIIDCSGCASAIEYGATLLNKGGKLCIFGVASPSATITISPYQLYANELKIIAINTNPFSFAKSLELIHSLGDRYLNYEKLGIKTFDLKNYEEAIEDLKERSISKAIFKLQ